jgi:hypothetical protein
MQDTYPLCWRGVTFWEERSVQLSSKHVTHSRAYTILHSHPVAGAAAAVVFTATNSMAAGAEQLLNNRSHLQYHKAIPQSCSEAWFWQQQPCIWQQRL